MNHISLKKTADEIKKIMATKNITPKDLAKKTGVSYPTIINFLHGKRDCSVSKLLAILHALEIDIDNLFNTQKISLMRNTETKFLAVFISIISVTYCMLYDIQSNQFFSTDLEFPLRCGDDSSEFFNNIFSAIDRLARNFKRKIDPKEVAVFTSVQQYGRKTNREKIQNMGEKILSYFMLESDAITNHQAFIKNNNGICVTINTGAIITYSIDKGENISSLQGYGFPVSDMAGSYWLGCEAIKHVINVKEQREQSTLISERLLAHFNDDINYLSTCAMQNPQNTYLIASSFVKEFLSFESKAHEIVKRSFDLLYSDIKTIDVRVGTKLPIFISGDLAYLYESFFPKERLIKIKEKQKTILFEYGLNKLRSLPKDQNKIIG